MKKPAATEAPLSIPAAGEWTFENTEVAKKFDAHVREQLPWYDLATGIVVHVARHFIPTTSGLVFDVGASTGNIARAIEPVITSRKARLVALDPVSEMLAGYHGQAEVRVATAQETDFTGADLIICFLVLMFVPVYERKALIERMIGSLRLGGGLVIFDKAAPQSGDLGSLASRLTLAAKYEAGAKPDQIIAKELSLAGVQRPLYPSETVGLREFFRFGDFVGWVYSRQGNF